MITKTQKEVEELLGEIGSIHFAESGQIDTFKNEVAKDLNHLLGGAVWRLGNWGDSSDVDHANALLRIVRRVAEFEEIESK